MFRTKNITLICVLSFVLLLFCDSAYCGECKQIKTDKTIGLENGLVRIEFDKTSGSLVSLKNVVKGDEYLKTLGGNGNPFRVYINPQELPKMITAEFPWMDALPKDSDTFGGKTLEAKDCSLTESFFEYRDGVGVLKIITENSTEGLVCSLEVKLPDNDDAVDMALAVKNKGINSTGVLTAFPYFTGLALGENRKTNLAVKMKKHGIAGEPAWEDSFDNKTSNGGIYGKQIIMQWQDVYDPNTKEGFGLIVMDGDLRTKGIYRFEGGGMSVLYFPTEQVKAGESLNYPSVRLIIHQGNWKKVARRYGDWFRSTFKLRLPPQWYNELDMQTSSWMPSLEAVAEAKKKLNANPAETQGLFTSFSDLPQIYANNTYDMLEFAMYHQGLVNTLSYGQDGTYYFRSDLGGPTAFHEGVEKVHKMGRKVMFYVASISSRKDSDLFKGTNIEDWLLMERPGKMYDIGYPDGVSMCFGYKPWQNHIAHVCKRLLWESGADGVRLDEFGTPAVLCYNPAHHHASPYDGIKWGLEFMRVVREAMDEVNPQAILMSEGSCDFMHMCSDAGGLQMFFAGREIEPLRVALPTFRGPSHSQGAIETALNGWVASTNKACRGPVFPGWGEWLPAKPEGYPADGGPDLKWNELRPMFHEAQVDGMVTDEDPIAPDDAKWVGRLWCAADYQLLIGGHLDATPLNGPTKIKLPELPKSVGCAYEFDTRTLSMRQAQLVRNGDNIFVTVTSDFCAVLLPTPQCKPIVTVESEMPSPGIGNKAEIKLGAFSPWAQVSNPKITVEMPGMELETTQLTLPGTVKFKVPPDAIAGNYYIKVKGQCLPLKRWIKLVKQ